MRLLTTYVVVPAGVVTPLISFVPEKTILVKMKFGGVCDVGFIDVSVGTGEDMVAGEVVNYSPRLEMAGIREMIDFYVVAAVATSVRTTKMFWD